MAEAMKTGAGSYPRNPDGSYPRPQTWEQWEQFLGDPIARLCSGFLYSIMTKDASGEETNVQPFIPNRAQRRFLSRLWHRNIILKARQLGFCQDENMRVLTADLQWVRIAELEVGTEIVAVDEHAPPGKGSSRKMRTAIVEAKAEVFRRAFRIDFDDGRHVICTGQHPWLSRKAGTKAEWRAIEAREGLQGRLKVGTQVRWVTKPWDTPTVEDGWMGGMLDGEGSIKKANTSASINVSQREGAVWDRLNRYVEERGYSACTESDEAERLNKYGKVPVPKLAFGRMDEMFRLIGQTRPTRFIGYRFWEGREMPGKKSGIGWATITKITELADQKMIDLQTSTGTYICEGFVSHNTTLVCIMFLDHALFVDNQRCMMVAQDLPKATALFRDKVGFAYDRLPQAIKDRKPLKSRSKTELEFANNSSFQISNSARGGTLHRLHISEMGKIGAKTPDKAKEIVTGSFPAVPAPGGIIIVESTAEGQAGEFFRLVDKAQGVAQLGRKLNLKEFRLSFYPWWEEPGYELDPLGVTISKEDIEYFAETESVIGKALSPEKRAWYVATRENDFAGDEEKMWQEYPSTVEEAFKVSTEGTYYAKQLASARKQKRIGRFPYTDGVPVHSFWDIGNNDGTGIWLMQELQGEHRFIEYIEGWDQPYSHYVGEMQRRKGYIWGTHHLPHDAGHKRQEESTVDTPLQKLKRMARDLGGNWIAVPRVDDINHGIQITRSAFSASTFDEAGCKAGLIHLQNYRREWNERMGIWNQHPRKDEHTEAADAYRQYAQGFRPTRKVEPKGSKRVTWRTA